MESKLLKALRSDASFVVVCLLLGAALRLLQIGDFSQSPLMSHPLGPDVSEYDDWAKSILSGQLLWTQVQIHAPLYPYFLAGLYKLTNCDMALVRLLQTLLGLVAGIPLFLMMRDVVAKAPAHFRVAPRLFLLLWAVFPLGIQYQSELFSEALLAPLLIFSAWFLHEADKHGISRVGLAFASGAGLFAGLSIITHPSAIFFVAVELCWALFCAFRHFESRKLLKPAIFLLLAILPVLPVCLYNSHLAGRLSFVQANGGFNFYLGNNEDANGCCYLRPGPEWDACHGEAQIEADRRGVSKDAVFFERSFKWIAQHSFDWAALTFKKSLYAINVRELPTSAEFSLSGGTFIERNLWFVFGPFAVLALLGLWLEMRRGGGVLPALRHILLLGLAFWIAQAVFVAGGRYRMPMHPALIVLAVFALLSLIGILASRRRSLEILAVVCVASMLVYAPAPRLDIPRLRAEADSSLAEAYLLAGRPLLALERIDASLPALSGWDRTFNVKGQILQALGRDAEAVKVYESAIERFPKSHYAYMNLGSMASDRGDLVKAKALFETALSLKPDDPDLLYNIGLLAMRSGYSEKADTLYRKCLALKPAHRKALNNLGASLLMKGDAKAAESLFEKALAVDPSNASVMANLAAAKLSLGDNLGARDLLAKARSIDPGNKTAEALLKSMER